MSPPVVQPPVRDRLRIAIQKNGRLSEPARALLSSCGLSWRESPDRLFCYGETAPVDLLLVRDDDIPGLITSGVCDLGIVGRNVLLEQVSLADLDGQPYNAKELRPLGFGGCRLAIAVPQAWTWTGIADLRGRRIATSYPGILQRWLDDAGIDATTVQLSGSVEIAPRLGQADVVCDLVSSGATLAANQLTPVIDLMTSEAVLVGTTEPLDPARAALLEMLLRRLDGVLKIRDSKLLMFRAARTALPELMSLLPDAESPTVLGVIEDDDAVSLQTLCHGVVTWQRLEALQRAGARGLMVLPVERMLA